MSVRVEDRGEEKFDVLTKALKLAVHTVNITDNKKVFVPEHEKLTSEIVYFATDIYHKARVANEIKFLQGKDLLEERRKLQNEAIKECTQFISKIYIAKHVFHLRSTSVSHWVDMVEEVKKLLKGWMESDAKRFKEKHLA